MMLPGDSDSDSGSDSGSGFAQWILIERVTTDTETLLCPTQT